jgi:esterase/lipase
MQRHFFSIFGVLALASLHTPSAVAQSACDARIQQDVARNNRELEAYYRSQSDGRDGVKAGNQSRYLVGTNPREAVLLVHGFMASPFEVQTLGRGLNRDGLSVLMPLLPGFGSSAHVANQSHASQWQRTLRLQLGLLASCYDSITLVGFSLGGALSLDFALSDAPEDRALQSKITRLGLVSPLVKSATKLSGTINNLTRLFASSVSIRKLFDLTQNPDLLVPMSYPNFYNSEMPLDAVAQTLKLSRKLKRTPRWFQSSIPTYLSVSEQDQTIDWQEAVEFSQTHFSSLELRRFDWSAGEVHQLPLSPKAVQITRDLSDLILKSF